LESYEVMVVGAGAAGLICAIEAGKRGRSVLLLDHADQVGNKILISGGGRCNFTNLYAEPGNFICSNPHFVKSALSRFTPYDFLAMVEAHGIAWEEREHGQLFCCGRAKEIVEMLLQEAASAGVEIKLGCEISLVEKGERGFTLQSSRGHFRSESLVIATGGLSIPKLGATRLGHQLARQFGLPLVATQAALVPLRFTGKEAELLQSLAGLSLPVTVSCLGQRFTEAMLFTHRGLSGPAILQISSYWQEGEAIELDLLPGLDAAAWLVGEKAQRPKLHLHKLLSEQLPKRLVGSLAPLMGWIDQPLHSFTDAKLAKLGGGLGAWRLLPAGSEGYRSAEATRGGVDTAALSSKTMEVREVPGLYFIGEVVVFTGELGGFNFQWAWASGHTAGQFA